MFNLLPGGKRPDITPAQVIAGIPFIAKFLTVYGIWSPTPDQLSSLSDLITWGFVLMGADAVIRVGRNVADGLKQKNVTIEAPIAPDEDDSAVPAPR